MHRLFNYKLILILKLNTRMLSFLHQIQTKLLFMMLMVAIGNFGEAKSGSSDSDSSSVDDDDSVTLTTCKLRGSESHSSSFDDEDTYGQCMSVYILRRSGNITMSDNRLGKPTYLRG